MIHKCLSKIADKMFFKRGWTKTYEGLCVQYIKTYTVYKHPVYEYTTVLEINHKHLYPNCIVCYKEQIDPNKFDEEAAGIPNDILFPIILKMISMGCMWGNKNNIP